MFLSLMYDAIYLSFNLMLSYSFKDISGYFKNVLESFKSWNYLGNLGISSTIFWYTFKEVLRYFSNDFDGFINYLGCVFDDCNAFKDVFRGFKNALYMFVFNEASDFEEEHRNFK